MRLAEYLGGRVDQYVFVQEDNGLVFLTFTAAHLTESSLKDYAVHRKVGTPGKLAEVEDDYVVIEIAGDGRYGGWGSYIVPFSSLVIREQVD